MLFSTFMAGIPRELMQAAEVDGASSWVTFRRIVMPISRNSAVTVALFAFLWAWSDFVFASTLNRDGGRLRPITMGLYDYIGSQNQEWGPLMATAVVASIPTAILLVVAQRYVAAGVTAGAVKD
jgi:multiple sugar transport system permease protein